MNLAGKRVLITRPEREAAVFAAALLAEGAVPVFFPMIGIDEMPDPSELDCALRGLDGYDWLVFSSVHAVDAFFSRKQALGISALPGSLRTAAIGPKTAGRLQAHRVAADLVPTDYTAEGILRALKVVAGKRFLLPQSDLARRTLADGLRAAGGFAEEIVVYRTVSVQPSPEALAALRSGVDVITFASPSSVENFASALYESGLDVDRLPGAPCIACIGPVTSAAARANGFSVDVEAGRHTMDGLLEALKATESAVFPGLPQGL